MSCAQALLGAQRELGRDPVADRAGCGRGERGEDGLRPRPLSGGASDAAYAAVREPAEGTILTVSRALAEEAEAHREGRAS